MSDGGLAKVPDDPLSHDRDGITANGTATTQLNLSEFFLHLSRNHSVPVAWHSPPSWALRQSEHTPLFSVSGSLLVFETFKTILPSILTPISCTVRHKHCICSTSSVCITSAALNISAFDREAFFSSANSTAANEANLARSSLSLCSLASTLVPVAIGVPSTPLSTAYFLPMWLRSSVDPPFACLVSFTSTADSSPCVAASTSAWAFACSAIFTSKLLGTNLQFVDPRSFAVQSITTLVGTSSRWFPSSLRLTLATGENPSQFQMTFESQRTRTTQ